MLRVVLDSLIVPEHAKFSNRWPSATPLIEDQTISLNGGKMPDRRSTLLERSPINGWVMPFADEVRRQHVVESFESQNLRPHELPDFDRPDVVRVETERTPEVFAQHRDRTVGVARFSLPGYSSDGYAVVVAGYGCGGQCGISWLVVLEKTTGSSRVAKAIVLGLS